MEHCDVASLDRHSLRLIFFDFSIRGLGNPYLVAAVVREWERLGGLTSSEKEFWLDALDWREAGNSLPGWVPPAEASPCELARLSETASFDQFRAWRLTRREEAAA